LNGISSAGAYTWTINTPNSFNSMTGSEGRLASLDSDIAFSDVTIPTNNGSTNPQTISDFARIVRLSTLTTRVFVSISDQDKCYPITRPIYAAWGSTVFPGDNPLGSNTNFFPRLYQNLTTAAPFVPTSGEYPGGSEYWLTQIEGPTTASSDQICRYNSSGDLQECSTGTTCSGVTICSGTCLLEADCPDGCVCTDGNCVAPNDPS
jgi:hypothetical protein